VFSRFFGFGTSAVIAWKERLISCYVSHWMLNSATTYFLVTELVMAADMKCLLSLFYLYCAATAELLT